MNKEELWNKYKEASLTNPNFDYKNFLAQLFGMMGDDPNFLRAFEQVLNYFHKSAVRLSTYHKAEGEGCASVPPPTSSGGVKNSDIPDPRKKRKKKTLVDHIKSTKELKAAFDPQSIIGALFSPQSQIIERFEEVEIKLKNLAQLPKATALNKFVYATTARDAVAQCVSKLTEVREVLRNAEMVETNDTTRSILIDLDKKIRDLASNIKYLDSNLLQ